MPQFKYAGKSSNGTLNGTIEAASENAAAQILLSRDIVPLSITKTKAETSSASANNLHISNLFEEKIGLDEMIIFRAKCTRF